MIYVPFAQSQVWAEMNHWFNGLEPVIIESCGVRCLFGFDKNAASITSYNGPIVPDDCCTDFLLSFLNEVLRYAKANNIFYINFRSLWPFRKHVAVLGDALNNLGFKKQNWNTIIIDLGFSEDELLKSFKHAARKSIKRAQELAAQVEHCNSFDQYYDEFLIPYFALKNREVKDKEFYRYGWNLDQENIYNYWVAKSTTGEALGFLGTYSYNGVATEIMSALTPLAYTTKIPAQDLLHYEIIKFHKNLGDAHFDLAGFNPNPSNEKEINIRRFKEKWGGAVYDNSSYTLDLRSFMQKAITKIKRVCYG